MKKLHENLTVQKRNILNELHSNNMTLQELRFFSIYLAKIDSKDENTRTVRFSVEDFQKIMEIGRVKIQHFKEKTDSLLGKKVSIPLESGGYKTFVLFDECKVDKDKNNQWYVEISASKSAIPYMFNFKNQFFQYKLWNALSLKSANQIRMYELLKQYEKVGKKEFYIDELKELLGIDKTEYTSRNGMNDFKKYVLESCKRALKENTDICYTYEKGKIGKSGKWLSIIFYIEKNTEYKDKLSLEKFIELQSKTNIIEADVSEERDADSSLEKTDFTDMVIWAFAMSNNKRYATKENVQEYIEFCKIKMDLEIQTGKEIKNQKKYLQRILNNSIDEFLKVKKEQEMRETKQSYDINEFEKYAINYQAIQQANGETAESDIIKDNDTTPEITDMPLNEADDNHIEDKSVIVKKRSEVGEEFWTLLLSMQDKYDDISYKLIDDTQ